MLDLFMVIDDKGGEKLKDCFGKDCFGTKGEKMFWNIGGEKNKKSTQVGGASS